MRYRNFATIIASAVLLVSCSTSKTTLPYFTDISETVSGRLAMNATVPVIAPDDELFITVTSQDPSLTTQYNIPAGNAATREELNISTQPRQLTYIVDSKGDIDFPILGKMHVAGMTVEQLQQQLVERISSDVKNPIVRVELINFKVMVAGEVTQPGIQRVTSNRYTILDALTQAGDLTPYGRRENVLVVREENGERTFTHLNLNSTDIFSSPAFYLKQNDYVYVEPNDIRQANSRYNQDNAFKLTVISTIVSAASVVASMIIALTVK